MLIDNACARVHRPVACASRGRGALPLRPWHRILIALALLLLQGPVIFHLLVVPHATCVHGELVEAHAEMASDEAQQRLVPARSDD